MTDQESEKIERLSSELHAARQSVAKLSKSNEALSTEVIRWKARAAEVEDKPSDELRAKIESYISESPIGCVRRELQALIDGSLDVKEVE